MSATSLPSATKFNISIKDLMAANRSLINETKKELTRTITESKQEMYLPREKVLEIAHKYMDRMGIKDTQYHIVRHNEKNNPHCHIVWNRVDENGRRYHDSNERKRSVQVCKQLTKEYGLQRDLQHRGIETQIKRDSNGKQSIRNS